MNPKLRKKVIEVINKEARFGNWSKKLVANIIGGVDEDSILPRLELRSNAHVSITYPNDLTINILIGKRDISFDRKTGEVVGTRICFFLNTY